MNRPPLSLVCSVADAARILEVSEERVLQFVRDGRIDGKQLKREWVLSLSSVRSFAKKPRRGGRPKS